MTHTSVSAPAVDNDDIPPGNDPAVYWSRQEHELAAAKVRLARWKADAAAAEPGSYLAGQAQAIAEMEARLAAWQQRIRAARDLPAPGIPHVWGTAALSERNPDDVITWWPGPQWGSDQNMYGPMKRGEMKAMVERMAEREAAEARERQARHERLAAAPNPYDGMTRAELRALGYPDAAEDEDRYHLYCRALDVAGAEDARREAAEQRTLQRAGLAPLPATWWGHLVWLHRQFGDRSFTTGQVCEAGFDDPDWTPPPGFRGDLTGSTAARELGTEYAKVARRVFDGAWIEPGPVTHGVRRWRVTVKDDPV
jgi:hypothetical protein